VAVLVVDVSFLGAHPANRMRSIISFNPKLSGTSPAGAPPCSGRAAGARAISSTSAATKQITSLDQKCRTAGLAGSGLPALGGRTVLSDGPRQRRTVLGASMFLRYFGGMGGTFRFTKTPNVACKLLEARVGIEPTSEGFADLG